MVVIVATERRDPKAFSRHALVHAGAGIVVVARSRVIGVETTLFRVAHFIRALVIVVAVQDIPTHADIVFTSVFDSAEIFVTARSSVGLVQTAIDHVRDIISAGITVIALLGLAGKALAFLALIANGQHIAVLAWSGVVDEDASLSRVASVIGARIDVLADNELIALAGTIYAGIACGAGIFVIARDSVVSVSATNDWVAVIVCALVGVIAIHECVYAGIIYARRLDAGIAITHSALVAATVVSALLVVALRNTDEPGVHAWRGIGADWSYVRQEYGV